MSNIVQVETLGFDDLEKQLKEMLPKAVRKHLKKAMTDAAEPVVAEMKSRAPVRTGTLRDGISASPVKLSSKQEKASVQIGPTKVFHEGKEKDTQADQFYARFLEFGTSKMAAQPFIGPAFDASAHQSLDKIVNALGEAIDEGSK